MKTIKSQRNVQTNVREGINKSGKLSQESSRKVVKLINRHTAPSSDTEPTLHTAAVWTERKKEKERWMIIKLCKQTINTVIYIYIICKVILKLQQMIYSKWFPSLLVLK